ncbi:MAG: SAM-dependent methyltransferase [Anaerolineales bacterium]|nr:SAM-dependent methyltransferase [Anaerolineales bacterium]
MNYETLLQILRLALRVVEVLLGRRAAKRGTPPPPTRADKVVARVAPLAEKVLDRVAPETATAASSRPRRKRRSASFALAQAALFGAIAAGGAAYVVAKQQRRVRNRYWPVRAPFPEELLNVLAAPGSGARLAYTDEGLRDPDTGRLYPIVDGIPDFLSSPISNPAGRGASSLQSLSPEDGDWLRLRELVDPVKPWMLGFNHAGNAALAGAVAEAAGARWALSIPCGRGDYEIEMARANPHMRLLCLSERWDDLLETRRRALELAIANLYCVRGDPNLPPLQDAALGAVWTANGFHLYPEPERMMTQIARVAQPGARVAGVSLVADGPRQSEALVRLAARDLPGRRDVMTHFTLLAAAGLIDLRAFRDGAYVRFTCVRG